MIEQGSSPTARCREKSAWNAKISCQYLLNRAQFLQDAAKNVQEMQNPGDTEVRPDRSEEPRHPEPDRAHPSLRDQRPLRTDRDQGPGWPRGEAKAPRSRMMGSHAWSRANDYDSNDRVSYGSASPEDFFDADSGLRPQMTCATAGSARRPGKLTWALSTWSSDAPP